MSSAALAPCTPFSGEMPRSEWEEFVPTAVTRVARSEDRLTATYTVDGQSKRKQQRFTTSLTELGDVLRALGEKVVADGVVDDRPCASASAKRARAAPDVLGVVALVPRLDGDVVVVQARALGGARRARPRARVRARLDVERVRLLGELVVLHLGQQPLGLVRLVHRRVRA